MRRRRAGGRTRRSSTTTEGRCAAARLKREVVEQLVENDRTRRGAADLRVGVLRADSPADNVGCLERRGVEGDVGEARGEIAAGVGAHESCPPLKPPRETSNDVDATRVMTSASRGMSPRRMTGHST